MKNGDKMKCKICGKEIEKSSYNNEILCSSKCFHKNFWNEIIKNKNNHLYIDGVCYWIGPENEDRIFRGYDGRKFLIQMTDNEKVLVTTNLWCQGDIPNEYKEILKDNAVFLNGM